jgi:probable HAF family extracellular repeat protein
VVWEPDGKLFQLRGPGGDYLRGRAWAINNDAVIVGEVEAPQQPAGVSQTAFRWSLRDGMTLLPSLGGFASVAYDVNRSGQVVGKSQTQAGATRAFLWTADGGVRDLGALPGHQHSEAVAINDKGWVVGFSYSEGDFYGGRAFLWTPERGMESFNPNGFFYATDVNHWGEVTGWGYDETGARTGLVWHRENGLLALEKLGRAFSHAYAINSWGDVAGTLDNQAMDDRAPAVWTWAGNEGRYKP